MSKLPTVIDWDEIESAALAYHGIAWEADAERTRQEHGAGGVQDAIDLFRAEDSARADLIFTIEMAFGLPAGSLA